MVLWVMGLNCEAQMSLVPCSWTQLFHPAGALVVVADIDLHFGLPGIADIFGGLFKQRGQLAEQQTADETVAVEN